MTSIQDQQILPISLQEAWTFFTNPKHLLDVTPASIPMKVIGDLPEKIEKGTLINYAIKPFLNIPFHWQTIITAVVDETYFIDEIKKGPYKYWHHEHHFQAVAEGTLMTDILHYDIGKSIFGYLAGKLFVDEQVKNLFVHRKKYLKKCFSKLK